MIEEQQLLQPALWERLWCPTDPNVTRHTLLQVYVEPLQLRVAPTRVDAFTGYWDARGVPIFTHDVIFDNHTKLMYESTHPFEKRLMLFELSSTTGGETSWLSTRDASQLQVVGYADPQLPNNYRFHNPEPRSWYEGFLNATVCLKRPKRSAKSLAYQYAKPIDTTRRTNDIERKAG